jgi:hypothetical protein
VTNKYIQGYSRGERALVCRFFGADPVYYGCFCDSPTEAEQLRGIAKTLEGSPNYATLSECAQKLRDIAVKLEKKL